MYYDYSSRWLDFEKRLFSKYTLDSIKAEYLKTYLGQISALDYFWDKYQLDNDYIKSRLTPHQPLFEMDEKEQKKHIDYYVAFFGSAKKLVRYLNQEASEPYGSIFDIKKEIVFERLEQLCEYFKIEEEMIVSVALRYTGIFSLPFQAVKEKIEKLAQFLTLEENRIKTFAIQYPAILGVNPKNYESKIPYICDGVGLSYNEYVSIIKKYPPIIICSKTELLQVRKDDLLKFPFLVRVVGWHRCNSYWGYAHYGEFVDEINYIQENYGKIIEGGVLYYNKIPFPYLIVSLIESSEYAVFSIGDDRAIVRYYLPNCKIIQNISISKYSHYKTKKYIAVMERFISYNSMTIERAIEKCCEKRYDLYKEWYEKICPMLRY